MLMFVVMNIMLLNLLIAIMSNSFTEIQVPPFSFSTFPQRAMAASDSALTGVAPALCFHTSS